MEEAPFYSRMEYTIDHKSVLVMPALVAGIHDFPSTQSKDVDGRDEPGHDEV